MVLKKINEPDCPLQIKAIYWDGKMKKAVVFEQQN
ncbi:hypothetical protein ABIB62_004091 [Mucilaginibacter sp. UYP25]